ncbi:acyl-CoA oxidase [Streptomyces spiroverticillatus]|uniref:Acyl-CoA oxidase n=1 Tax=Streptomyces finlayi TaxID=67296 RepID=A0A918X9C8_9ACTN|nr:acyl-CoA dehydrogenase [Streptomyces finlayi]GHA49568.1 acyl-CoA oxidase [Streptomyces spiroverticillatus]GHD19394.1 acyl-CoA oxidase [Streptomyces finlayi]
MTSSLTGPPPPATPSVTVPPAERHRRILHGRSASQRLERLDRLLDTPLFRTPAAASADDPLRTYARLRAINAAAGDLDQLGEDPTTIHTILEWTAAHDPALTLAAHVHYAVCLQGLLPASATNPYAAGLLAEMRRGESIGAILITELGRGGSHLSPETEARYDPEARTFTLTTPHDGALKFMSNVAHPGVPRTALLFARLLSDGQDHGPHPFVLPLHHPAHPLTGVRIDPLPPNPAWPLDNALVRFEGTVLPYDAWLHDSATLAPDGTLTDPLTPDRRLLHSLAISSHASAGAVVAQAAAARAAATSALRYATTRTTTGRLAPGENVLAYRTQRQALYTALADSHALTLATRHAQQLLRDLHHPATPRENTREGSGQQAHQASVTWAPWSGVHLDLALIKAHATETLEQVGATARRRSGAQGLLAVNHLAGCETLAHIFQSAAGDNLLIQLDAGKLLTDRARVQASRAALRPGPVPAALPSWDLPAVLRHETYRLRVLTHDTLSRAPRPCGPGAPALDAWDPVLPRLVTLARCHTSVLMLRTCRDQLPLPSTDRSAQARALRALRRLYALTHLERHVGWHLEHGTLTADDADRLRGDLDAALDTVHPYIPDLVELLAPPRARTTAPLAAADPVAALVQASRHTPHHPERP